MTDNENKQRRIDDRLPGQPLVWDEESAQEQIVSLHRQLAAEKLRADQGWERADAKSRECIELRERLAAAPSQAAAEVRAAAQFRLPNGWKIDRGGDDLRLRSKDGMWCGFTPIHDSPAHRLTHEFLGDLLAAIEAGTLAEAPATAWQSQWISVEDRLPDLHVTVALLDENRWMNTGSDDHSINWHGAGYLCEFGQKYWSIFGEMRSQCLDAVTHWMPLPAAPESAQGETGGE